MTAEALDWRAAKTIPLESTLLRLELPPVTMTQLVFYCGAAGVTDPIHYDRDCARQFGFRDAVVNGSLRVGWMAEAAASLVRAPDSVRAFKCKHVKGMHLHEEPVIEIRLRERKESAAAGEVTLICDIAMHVGSVVTDRGEAELCFRSGTS